MTTSLYRVCSTHRNEVDPKKSTPCCRNSTVQNRRTIARSISLVRFLPKRAINSPPAARPTPNRDRDHVGFLDRLESAATCSFEIDPIEATPIRSNNQENPPVMNERSVSKQFLNGLCNIDITISHVHLVGRTSHSGGFFAFSVWRFFGSTFALVDSAGSG
jgi:hypothetical protein